MLVVFMTAASANAIDIQFLPKTPGGLEIRAYPDYKNLIGWEANIYNNPRLLQIGSAALGIKCDVRPISGDRPTGVDFKTINFNLWPEISYDIDSAQTVTFGWYHWSEHWYHRDKDWLMNINMLAADYKRKTKTDTLYAFIGDNYDGDNYPITWLAKVAYQRKFLKYLEPGVFETAFRYDKKTLFLTDIQLAVNFKDKYSIIGGYKIGSAPMIMLQPTGPYWGFVWHWK